MSVEIVTLIHTRLATRGTGKSMDDVVRVIDQWWTMDGQLVFEIDPCPEPRRAPEEEDHDG